MIMNRSFSRRCLRGGFAEAAIACATDVGEPQQRFPTTQARARIGARWIRDGMSLILESLWSAA
jgi:hypothetical protein